MRRTVFAAAFTAFFLSFAVSLHATDIGATGGWTDLVIGSSDLQGGAGTDLQDSYTSGEEATTLNVTGTSGSNGAWKVQVRMDNTSWQSEVILSVQRTGDGSGAGSISNGTSYTAVGTSDVYFFEGTGDKTAIPIQYKISGMSVSVPPGTYSTTLTFTVVDI